MLPAQATPLIGREKEVALLQGLLMREQVRLVTLTGPGGSGKTCLGLQVAREVRESFADGVRFIPLAPIADPGLVIPTIFHELGLQERGERSPLERLQKYLQPLQMLLLLDNFEQVIGAAEQLADLLAACPKLKIVVTSREVLHLRAEHEFPVSPLALPNLKSLPDLETLSRYTAVTLFIQRSQAVQFGFQLSLANASAVAEICARLDGLPLAIELAAARMKLFTPQALLARLSQRLGTLTNRARDVPTRHQTLRNTIAWSYHLLTAREQSLFRRLCIFIGGCTLEAIETFYTQLGDDEGTVLDEASSLIDKNLLRQMEQMQEEPRLLMLETIREYGLECLAASGEMAEIQRAHAAYYLALAEEAELYLLDRKRDESSLSRHNTSGAWLKRLECEHENLRAALHWLLEQGEAELALRLATALARFWWARGYLSEGRGFIERAFSVNREITLLVQVRALNAAGALAAMQGVFTQAEVLSRESLALSQEWGSTIHRATALYVLGYVNFEKGNYRIARQLEEEALAIFREANDNFGLILALGVLTTVLFFQGEYARANSFAEEALTLSRETGDSGSIARSLWELALVVYSQGNPVRARLLAEEALALCRNTNDRRGSAYALVILGYAATRQTEYTKASLLLQESLEIHREGEDRQGMAMALYGLGWVSLGQGEYMAAHTHYEKGLELGRELGSQQLISLCLDGLAAVRLGQGEPAWATRLWGGAEGLRQTAGLSLSPTMQIMNERLANAARTQLGEEVFRAMWAKGRAMTLEQLLTV